MMQVADTFYFIALLNPKDLANSAALAHSYGPGIIVTSEWVLMEVADAMAIRPKRKAFIELHGLLRSHADVEIIPASAEFFARAVEMFAARPDKNWSLTDCTSFLVMQDRGIRDALTGDHHFEQAGFRALLK
jgi:predicted nucleic acid-binding protein